MAILRSHTVEQHLIDERRKVPLCGHLLGWFGFGRRLSAVAIEFADDGCMNFGDSNVDGNGFLAGQDGTY